jgi:tetratricopeptide (TPR) repeat protein
MNERRAADPTPPGLVDAAIADPAAVRREVTGRLAATTDGAAPGDHELRWALGVALRELGELEGARDELERAAAAADAGGDAGDAGLIRSSLALVVLHLGDTEGALGLTEVAADSLTGAAAARNEMQRGLLLQRLGRNEESIAAYDGALPALRDAGDLPAQARLLSNRGVLRAYQGELAAARGDLERSVAMAEAAGSARGAALARQNLGFVAGRQGRLPEALELLEQAHALLRDLDDGAPALAVLDADRAEVLADAGLLDEAITRADAAAEAFDAVGDQTNLAEAELLGARLRLLAGHAEDAAAWAERARARFAAAERPGWELQARYVAMAARAGAADHAATADRTATPERAATPNRAGATDPTDGTALSNVEVAGALRLADDLAAGGWEHEARAARLSATRQALAAGDTRVAEATLAQLRGASRRAPALVQAQQLHATALSRTLRGDRGGARRAITAGLGHLHRSRLLFGSAELRAHAARHTTDLVELAVRLALEDGRPGEALRAVDQVRAADLGAPLAPPDDPQLAADLAELRHVAELEREAARDGLDPRRHTRRRAAVERRIRDRARTLAHPSADPGQVSLDLPVIRRRLAGRTLAAYLQLDGRLHLLAVTPRATRHVELGAANWVRRDVVFLRSALRRLAHNSGTAAGLAAAAASVDRSGADLVRALGLDQLDPEGLVVVPTGVLDGLPWGALAADTGHVPTIAPSALGWLRATERRPADGPAVVAVGPELPGAAAEVRALSEARPSATMLAGDAATAGAVLRAIDGADTVHLAAHGVFRADNPLLSSLRLADGPLTVYELGAIRRPPRLLVLPSCDAAVTTSVGGDAVLGLSAALLRAGVATLIAPAVPIPDEATGPVMVALHRRLAAGDPPAAALGTAVAGDDMAPEVRAVQAAFVVLGASESAC